MLHIGNDCLIPKKGIIAILDAVVLNSKDTQCFFNNARGNITQLADEYSSIIVTYRNKKQHIYLSPISCATLYKRSRETLIVR